MSLLVLLLASACFFAADDPDVEFVWLEGEAASRTTFEFQKHGWGKAEYLAGAAWLTARVEAGDVTRLVHPDGANAAYDYRAPADGKYEVWARVGYEFARSPFRWRIDSGAWNSVGPNELTSDLMAIADSAEVAWLKLGTVDLTAGGHTLDVNVPRPAAGQGLLFGLDAVCLAKGTFTPNSRFKPGEYWKFPIDREAERTTFEFSPFAAPAALRQTLDLAGTWQIARFDENDIIDRTGPIAALPDLGKLTWHGIRVPGDRDAERPDLAYCHRYLYRSRVKVPAEFAGRSFVLRFPNNALLTTVFVNGKPSGFSKAPCANFDCDVTSAIKPGQVNEVVVGIKDVYYAIAKTGDGKSCRHLFNLPHARFHDAGATRFADFPVLGQVRRNGILETPSLIVGGPVYTADVFAIPSVSKKQLGLEVTLHNPSDKPIDVELRNAVRSASGGPVSQTFAPKTVTVAAGKSEVVVLLHSWEKPRLWWLDDPHLYVVTTTLAVAGKPVDEVVTTFGFREWGWAGRSFTLNSVPWHFRADLRHNSPQPGLASEAAVKEWRKNGQNIFRFGGEQLWTGTSQRETLDFFDKNGIAVRRSGLLDGKGANQLVIDGKANTALFDNWRHQLAAWVKAERNHPSILVWSLGSEAASVESEIRKAGELVGKLDPTRPVMIDRADVDLPVAGADVHGPFPDDRPLFLDASSFFPTKAHAAVLGLTPFHDRVHLALRLSELYRWSQGIAAFQLALDDGPDAEHHKAWQPVCVLAHEWNDRLPAATTVTRRLKVFNDTRFETPITVHWLLQTRDTRPVYQHRGKREFKLRPGTSEEFTIDLPTPPGDGTADLILTCVRGGREVFRDVRPCRIVGERAK